jgi:hypothetical protein
MAETTLTEKTLLVTAEGACVWKIPVVPHGSDGCVPQSAEDCPYYQEHGHDSSCVSGSGGSMCGGFMGGPAGSVYCIWGLYD